LGGDEEEHEESDEWDDIDGADGFEDGDDFDGVEDEDDGDEESVDEVDTSGEEIGKYLNYPPQWAYQADLRDRTPFTSKYFVTGLASTYTKSTIINNQKNSMAVGNQASSRLISLPPELQLRVFDLLDRCSSTCLGLSTRVFYKLHRAARGRVPLCAFYFVPGALDCSGFRLHVLLKEWAGPQLQYCEIRDRFVNRTSLEIERIERAMFPENPCERICCHELDPVTAQKFVAINRRDNQEKRKDAREAGKASFWWV